MSDSPVSTPDQHRCEFPGDPVPAGGEANFVTDEPAVVVYESEPHPRAENSPTAASASANSVPLNLFGRGYRWPGAKANGNAVRIAAAVDAELGAGAPAVMSPDGVPHQVIPRRAR
jgi:hypothetical protein